MDQKDWHKKCFYRVTIKAIILNADGKVLFVREKNNPVWNLPGGGMDYGENEYSALKRELHEEVGFKGEFTCQPLGIRPTYLEGKKAWQLGIIFAVVPDNFDFSVGEEALEIAFLDPAELKATRPHIYEWAKLASS